MRQKNLRSRFFIIFVGAVAAFLVAAIAVSAFIVLVLLVSEPAFSDVIHEAARFFVIHDDAKIFLCIWLILIGAVTQSVMRYLWSYIAKFVIDIVQIQAGQTEKDIKPLLGVLLIALIIELVYRSKRKNIFFNAQNIRGIRYAESF